MASIVGLNGLFSSLYHVTLC
uniref:Uncharacterized protein n=1 Tax=Anguilla anguilla TaxID=7936 RepID=A0A0E9VF68_ANGAN